MKNIDHHIQQDKEQLNDSMISSQRRGHLENELISLEQYHKNHPEDDHDPTPLELFCDENPGASECRVYEI